MSYDCELRTQGPKATMTVRTRTPVSQLPQALGKAYGEIAAYLGSLRERPAGPPFVAYHNMDMQDLDVEIGFPVSHPLPGQGKLLPGAMPEGQIATCLHTGPYEDIPAAYDALNRWIDEHGYQATGLAIEIYLNDPQTTQPAQLQTQIMLPLRAA